jgi:hypothetical protein
MTEKQIKLNRHELIGWMKWISAAILLFITPVSFAQGSDILLLKKRNGKTQEKYLRGATIQFTDNTGRTTEGTIGKIDKDSIFILTHDIRQRYTQWGTAASDTISAFLNPYHFREITTIRKPVKGFGFIRNGTLFIIGGTAYGLLHLVNAAILKEKVDGKTMALAGGVALSGWLIKKLHRYHYRIGSNYHLTYIDL